MRLQQISICLLFILVNEYSGWTQTPSHQSGQISGIVAEFKEPPLEARPRGLWDWLNGNFSYSQITKELKEAKAKGMGGFDIWDVGMLVDPDQIVPDGPAFLSDPSVQAIGYTVREAERIGGLELGLILSSSWNAGGSWIPPEYGAMGLFQSQIIVKGPSEINQKFPFPELPSRTPNDRHTNLIEIDSTSQLPTYYKEVAVLAIQYDEDSLLQNVIDISDHLQADGLFQWRAPEGNWLIKRYVCTGTGQPLAVPSHNSMGRMLDHFSQEAMKFNLDYIFARLEAELGSLENRALKYLYTDSYEVNSAVWTPLLPEEFVRRNGYELFDYLPVLDGFMYPEDHINDRFLFDIKKTLSDLIIENHYRFATEYCAEKGLGFYAEAGGPGPPVHNVPFEDLKALGSLTVPRGEFWNNHPRGEVHNNELQIIKGISSAAHIYNQPAVEAESFTSVWVWQEGPAQLKPLADRAMCEGLNRFIYHTFPHTPPESGNPGWVYNFGTLIHVNNSWWEQSESFHHYLARCSYLLQQGNFVGDVAFYYGDRAPNFVLYKQIPPALGFGYDYDVINTDAILNRLEVKDGKICLPHGQCYEVIVLPEEKIMNPRLLEKIQEFVNEGAVIIGPKPERSYRLNNFEQRDEKLRILADALWSDRPADSKIIYDKSIREVLLENGISPDIQTDLDDPINTVDYIHRITQEQDIYFLWNRTAVSQRFEISFRTGKNHIYIFDPLDGSIIKLSEFERSPERVKIPLFMAGFGSAFVVFSDQPLHTGSDSSKIGFQYMEHDSISVQESPIEGPWEIRFPHGWRAPARVLIDTLISWTEHINEGIRHFSGTATYYKNIAVDQNDLTGDHRIILDLGSVREIADLYINGHFVDSKWCAPYRFDITSYVHEGQNNMVIEVANVLSNRMTGDALLPKKYRQTKSNVTKGPTPWSTPWSEVPLIESGIIGPAKLLVIDWN